MRLALPQTFRVLALGLLSCRTDTILSVHAGPDHNFASGDNFAPGDRVQLIGQWNREWHGRFARVLRDGGVQLERRDLISDEESRLTEILRTRRCLVTGGQHAGAEVEVIHWCGLGLKVKGKKLVKGRLVDVHGNITPGLLNPARRVTWEEVKGSESSLYFGEALKAYASRLPEEWQYVTEVRETQTLLSQTRFSSETTFSSYPTESSDATSRFQSKCHSPTKSDSPLFFRTCSGLTQMTSSPQTLASGVGPGEPDPRRREPLSLRPRIDSSEEFPTSSPTVTPASVIAEFRSLYHGDHCKKGFAFPTTELLLYSTLRLHTRRKTVDLKEGDGIFLLGSRLDVSLDGETIYVFPGMKGTFVGYADHACERCLRRVNVVFQMFGRHLQLTLPALRIVADDGSSAHDRLRLAQFDAIPHFVAELYRPGAFLDGDGGAVEILLNFLEESFELAQIDSTEAERLMIVCNHLKDREK